MNSGRSEYTFLWFIENYSFCWHKNGEELVSPKFTFDGLEGIVWCIDLYPRGDGEASKNYISIFLCRCVVENTPEDFPLKFQLTLLAENGLPLKSTHCEYTFKKEEGYGSVRFIHRDNLLLVRGREFLPEDTLSVQCKIWKGEGNIHQVDKIAARTRIGIEQISFLHVTENFSTLDSNKKKAIDIKSPSGKHCALTSNVYFVDELSDGKIMVEITPASTTQILSKCKLRLQDASGKKIECFEADNRYATRDDIQNMPLSLTRQVILNEKSKYLPDDKLSLSCECTFATGIEYEKIEKVSYERPFVAQVINDVQNKDKYKVARKLSECPSALDELEAIYSSQLLTDVDIETKTKSFPAHKIMLCARSPVFKAMLTNDVKEKHGNSIQVDDLEDDTLQQLLLFLYTDKLGNLQWESALKLYYAGDKYEIEKLKVLCASFLLDNITPSSAIEFLILSDKHNDCDFKSAVENFILRHEEKVFGSEEWQKLAEVDSDLVSKTMLLKYKKN